MSELLRARESEGYVARDDEKLRFLWVGKNEERELSFLTSLFFLIHKIVSSVLRINRFH